MDKLKDVARRARDRTGTARRLAALEAEVQECRQVNLRLAELTDVVMELLVPLSERDESRVAEALKRYHDSVSDPEK
ncbi:MULTISPECIES: DUF6752 domain-containing protein [unclassified Nocardioides]|uniref:DUF6752 domain-containing protein n=1 Tax=unclassified Nocardioides TaxID=2615069 RepID=UPI0006F30763|nr:MULTISPECIES: DUF6752 domain-containing protein [unclassified Nocardioides]KQY56245.1 hypothetical protein ASD30_07765 [Nocardioides sp. Root140]KQZ75029.1 hypothetical protein ASD66_01230 [Nocardioides sp. Root151]KRF10564.1 hypothetical protein ASH02_20965 [Nocardioides sp. Soil796]